MNIDSSLFALAKTWKKHKCPSAGEQINKQWCVPTGKCNQTMRGRLLIHAVTWMGLKIIMLNETNHAGTSLAVQRLRIRRPLQGT